MYLISLSQSHDAASVIELSRSLEFDHEVRREVTLQVMRWFGQVDDADERWKMDVEKVVRQVGLGILRQYKVGFELFFLSFFPHALKPLLVSS
jgi:sister chromatid cohesion protein DCC1